VNKIFSLGGWVMNLFNPPPLECMTQGQKVGRVLLVATSLVIICIISAMLLASFVFLVQRMKEVVSAILASDFSFIMNVVGILVLSISVNAICVLVLLYVRRMDQTLMMPPPEAPTHL
jgi:hypothetical protein